jgi:hypothetical protein
MAREKKVYELERNRTKPGIVELICNPRTQKAEAGGL